ncbi:LON peptidase substrate-binding domain-containing protein [Amycolatopsis thermalba]|uniref:LON peptidase substrate-binding domain-containing protein n=1 Tax=Amycolatopsis thermalba TaxID=944492 RepID=A0ABY4P2E5_9PSEU|nr:MULTISPECIES: LON peptidase substrate-binding domain-containing protein [Amycolatopsis]OXM73456.1 peptidase [Amycolatopsis sp. KNN50.9b]UQS26448.1 LON peptidase substrate-binding domain-containing protein [Amycolatopsis thermalba]
MDAERQERATETIPLFPLQTVLLPGATLPLHLFEPRYRQLAVDLLTGTVPDRRFGIIAIRTSAVREVEDLDHVHPIGCAALLGDSERLPDGRFDIITRGERRFRVLDIDTSRAPYLVGTIEWVDDTPVPPAAERAVAGLRDAALSAHAAYCDAAWHRDAWAAPEPEVGPGPLSYLLAADCLLPLADRQQLLEETQPLRRLRMVSRMLRREAGFLTKLRAVPAPPPELIQLGLPASLN